MGAAHDLPEGIGFIDGAYCARHEMKMPVYDLGFMMADMTYDAAHVWKGRFFRLEDHLTRWERSISRRRYTTLPYNKEQVRDIILECVRKSGYRDALVYWIATRGVPSDHRRDLRTCQNRFMAWAAPFHWMVPPEQLERGEGANIYISSVLRTPPESSDPEVKNFARIDFSRACLEAYDHGSEYPVLLDLDGNVTEGRGWNIFALSGGTLISPDRGVLDGVTRKTVLELCRLGNIEGKLGRIRAEDLLRADELFLATTAGGIMPVTRVNDTVIRNGAVGPVTKRLTEQYWAMHEDPALNTPIDYDKRT